MKAKERRRDARDTRRPLEERIETTKEAGGQVTSTKLVKCLLMYGAAT